MTYRQFKEAYQMHRVSVTPDIADRLPSVGQQVRPLPRRHLLLPLVATAAAVVVLISGAVLSGLPTDTPVPEPTNPTTIPSGTPDLKVSAVLYKSLSSDTNVLPLNTRINRYVGARMVAVTADAPFKGHETCSNVFYQLDKNSTFCVDHTVVQALKGHGVSTAAVSIHFYDPSRDVVIFTLANGKTSYWYRIQTDTLKKLPVSLRHCPSPISTASESPYALLHSMGGGHDDLYLIDTQTGDLKNIVQGENGRYLFDPMEDETLIADNQYVLYTHGTGDGNIVTSPSRTSVLYHIASGNSYTFQGQVEASLSDRLLIQNPNGFFIYSLTDYTMTPLQSSGLPTRYIYQLRQTDLYSRYCYRLNVHNRLTGETELLCEEYIVSHLISPDHRYVYYYVRGDNYIRVHDMESGAHSTLPLFADVVAETESDPYRDRAILFSLWMNESGTEVVLTYEYTVHPREDPEEIRKEQENSSYHLFHELTAKNEFVSIASLKPLLKRFPERVVAYEGDGYLYVEYTQLLTENDSMLSDTLYVALEDYVHLAFHDLSHIGGNWDAQFVEKRQASLSADARQNTRTILAECGIPILPATKDYLLYFNEDTLNALKVQLEHSASAVLFPKVRSYFVSKAYGHDGAKRGLDSTEDRTALQEFLAFSDTLTYHTLLDVKGDDMYRESHTYLLFCYGYDLPCDGVIYIGRRQGQPFLVRNRCLAYITDTDYDYWHEWLASQEPKCHAD